jgi:hypothetical protein
MRACNKRLLLLAGLGLILTFSAKGQTYGSYNGFSWYSDNSQTAEITGYNGPGGDVAIPSIIIDASDPNHVIDYSVTSIGDEAFFLGTTLTNVTIPDSVTNIGDQAFEYCSSLAGVTIPSSVTNIGHDAFDSCTSLTSVTVPDSVTNIGDEAFYQCTSLSSVDFNGNAPAFGQFVFAGEFPTVYYLSDTTGWSNFIANNDVLAVPATVQTEFSYSTNAGNTIAIMDYDGDGTNVVIPDVINGLPVTSIGDGAFASTSLSYIVVPGSITNIGNDAFDDCTNLISLFFQGNAPAIGQDVFEGDPATAYYLTGAIGWNSTFAGLPAVPLAADQAQFYYSLNADGISITITGYNWEGTDGLVAIPGQINGLPVTAIGEVAFAGVFDCCSVNITIPNSVTSIGNGAFQNNAALYLITIPDSVTNMGAYAFYGCYGLGSVTIPGSVNSIGIYAFWGCSDLQNVTIGNGVTSIGVEAFGGFTANIPASELTSIAIPASVTNIGAGAFDTCVLMTAITVDTNNLFYSSLNGVLFNKNQTTLVEYPDGLDGNYTIPDSVTSIGDAAFVDCANLTGVTIPCGVTNIGEYAFAGCTSLTSVYFTCDAPAADSTVFEGDDFNGNNVRVYHLPGTTGWSNFTANTGLATISALTQGQFTYTANADNTATIVGYIGPGGAVAIPTNINSIPVTSIGDWAFEFSTLTSLTIPDGVTNIGDYAFEFCTSLANVTIPASVTDIGDYAFEVCVSLTSVTIPDGVTNIGDYAFDYCTSLNSIYFTGNAPTADSTVFESDLATVYYLPGTTGWSNPFAGLPALLWNPLIQTSDASFGVQSNEFGFNITGTANIPIVVEAATNLASPLWTTLTNINLANGLFYFSDPHWTNYPERYYRIASP